jgi:hypothetical protein
MRSNNSTSRNGRSRWALAVLALLPAASALASDLTVQNTNVNTENSGTNNFAARVAVVSACTDELHENVTGSIGAGMHVACSTLTSDADVTSGAVQFTAGDLVLLRNGFSVASGASLAVEINRTLYPDAWVQDNTPAGEDIYAARFYVDPTNLVLTSSDRFYHFLAFDAGGNPEVRVGMKQNGTERRLFLEVILDNGSVASTENGLELILPDGWQMVEVGWGTDGSAYLCVSNLSSCANLSALDNDTGAIDFVRWGAIDVPSDTDLGDLDLDDFESRSSLLIGPLP